jgi:DNA gyrase inhibitor GyrI
VFGFDNPAAAPGVSEYGYEFWLGIDPETQPPEPIGVKEFEGGLYAVTSCQVGPAMPDHWKALLRWVHTSQHRWRRSTHELEHLVNPLAVPEAMTVDLCLPVEE